MPLDRWSIPTPHELLTVLFLFAQAAKMSRVLAAGSSLDLILDGAITFFALAGVSSAKHYTPPSPPAPALKES